MGIELGVLVVSALFAAERGISASKEQKRAVRAQEEASDIGQAQQESERRLALRKQSREERVRRAQIEAEAQASGVSGGSSEISAIGVGQTLVAQGKAFATGQTLGNRAQTNLLQDAANFNAAAAFDVAQGKLGSALISAGGSAFAGAGSSTAGTTTAAPIKNNDGTVWTGFNFK